jgi:hypothetical protein
MSKISPSDKTTATGGPNGSMDWLNCGVEDDGWAPPEMSVDEVKVVDLDKALEDPKTPYKACAKYVSIFKQAGEDNNIPPIFLAAFAMQESSCNPDTGDEGAEQGLMQITPDKCHGAPKGNCKDPVSPTSVASTCILIVCADSTSTSTLLLNTLPAF